MPETISGYPNEAGSLTYIENWDQSAQEWVPMPECQAAKLKQLNLPSPRCPNIPGGQTVEDLLPFLDNIAKRPYSTGLWPAWDLHKDERVLVRMSTWHHPVGQ